MVKAGTRLLKSIDVRVRTTSSEIIRTIEDQSAKEPFLGKVYVVPPSSLY